MIEEKGILEEDIYNFDESRFSLGLIATYKVVTMSDTMGKPILLQPGNCEWVTVIEAINTTGFVILSYILFKGENHQAKWYQERGISPDWRIQPTPKGWISDDVGLDWLKNQFDPYTKPWTKGRYRLLVFDGHSSHLTPE